jgi:hypothetical protein
MFWIFWLLTADAFEFVVHPVIHVEDQIGDRVREDLDSADSQLGRDVFYARERISVRAFPAEEFGESQGI